MTIFFFFFFSKAAQDRKLIEERGQGDGVQLYKNTQPSASAQTCSLPLLDSALPSSGRNFIVNSQAKAFQKYKEEGAKENDLSRGPQDTTTVDSPPPLLKDSKKQLKKGTDLALTWEPPSHQKTLCEDRDKSLHEDNNFVNLEHYDCEESYTELLSSDFNTASEIQDSSDEDGIHNEASEEENLNVLGECKSQNFEKDLKELNIRDT